LASATIVLSLAACNGGGAREQERRIAIIHFEDLSSGGNGNWAGAALAEIAAARFQADPDFAFAVPSLREARLRYATHMVQGYFSRPDQLRVTLREEGTQDNTEVVVLPFEGPLRVSEPLIEALGGSPAQYTTASATAVEARWQSELAQNHAEAMAHAQRALAADPYYGAAHLRRVELARASGDPAVFREAVDAASARDIRYTAPESAKLAAVRAQLNGDQASAAEAALAFARAERSDPAAWMVAAQQSLLAKQPGDAAIAIGQAIRFEPQNAGLWNQLGYAQAFAGNLEQATRSLRRYAELQPRSPNPMDSLGEVHFLFKRFDDAALYFSQAAELDRNFLGGQSFARAALARFLAGDLSKADEHFLAYEQVLRDLKDPLIPVRSALWLKATGRDQAAKAELSKTLDDPNAVGPVRVAALSVRSFWLLSEGDRSAAAAAAHEAAGMATTPGGRLLPSTAAFLASPSTAAEGWEARVQRALPTPELEPLRDKLLAWALLLDGHEQESVAVWQRIWERTSLLGGAEEIAGYCLALAAAGQPEQIRERVPSLLPLSPTDPGWPALLFPSVVNVMRQPSPAGG
jgi:tetratricopeptide (TPR) repeat protein